MFSKIEHFGFKIAVKISEGVIFYHEEVKQVVFVALLVVAFLAAVSARVVFEDNFDDNVGFDVNHPASKWANGGFQSGSVSTSGSASHWTVNPVAPAFIQPYPYGFFTNVWWGVTPKALASGVELAAGEKLKVEFDLSFELLNAHAHPFGTNVTNADDDFRLGTCVVVVQEGTNAFCTMHTNEADWGFHEKFAYPGMTGTVNPDFKGYVNGKRLGTHSKGKYQKVAMLLDNDAGEISFYINNKLTHKVTNMGVFPVGGGGRDFIAFSHQEGAKNEPIKFTRPGVSVACVAEIDKPDPNDLESTVGLVNFNSPDELFNMPTSFVYGNDQSDISLSKSHFGQGIKLGVRKFKVEVI